MKTYIIPTAIAILFIAGCSTTKRSVEYDDVYATGKQSRNEIIVVEKSTIRQLILIT
jgi:protein involved in sex pheromone biosynthesis